MSCTVQDVLSLVEDYISANTGQISQPSQIRQIGQAVAYFKRRLALPSDEKISSFYWSDDNFFYAVPSDFEEELELLYNNPDLNIAEREFEFIEYSVLLKRTGLSPTKNQWSFTTINGSRQIMLVGRNINAGSVIENFDAVGNWTASGDASGLAQDLVEKKVGSGSLSFDLTNSTGLATIATTGLSLGVKTLFENHGYFKMWTRLTNANIDSIAIRLMVDASNYWTITETDFDDGTAFATNIWKKVGWALDNAVATGSPAITDTVTQIQIIFDLGAALTSATDFRIDHLFTTVPDYMDLIYRSANKGKNAAGTSLTTFTAVTDTIDICDYSSVFEDLIAKRAAMNLWPALRADINFYALYRSDLKEMIKDWGLRFPHKRKNKFLPTRLRR